MTLGILKYFTGEKKLVGPLRRLKGIEKKVERFSNLLEKYAKDRRLISLEKCYIYTVTEPSKFRSVAEEFLLFNYSGHLSKYDGHLNLGDYVQTIAVRGVLDKLYSPRYEYFDRDSLSFYQRDSNEKVPCIMQGWFSETESFLPSSHVLPVWVGVHFDAATQSFLRKVLTVRPKYFCSSVGCRDYYTLDFLRKNKIDSYFSRCLTLTLSKRKQTINGGRVFFVNVPSEFLNYVPNRIKDNAQIVNQRFVNVDYEHWSDSLKRTEDLLRLYREEASLVVTTALHVASPCVAMGIPVVHLMEDESENPRRFSALSGILQPVTVEDLRKGRFDWAPEPPDIEDLKDALIRNVAISVEEAKGHVVDLKEQREVREFISNYSCF